MRILFLVGCVFLVSCSNDIDSDYAYEKVAFCTNQDGVTEKVEYEADDYEGNQMKPEYEKELLEESMRFDSGGEWSCEIQ